jgi:hypothetical protein
VRSPESRSSLRYAYREQLGDANFSHMLALIPTMSDISLTEQAGRLVRIIRFAAEEEQCQFREQYSALSWLHRTRIARGCSAAQHDTRGCSPHSQDSSFLQDGHAVHLDHAYVLIFLLHDCVYVPIGSTTVLPTSGSRGGGLRAVCGVVGRGRQCVSCRRWCRIQSI